MSTLVNEMIAEKLDQVILLLQTQQSSEVIREKWVALQKELESIRHSINNLQLQAKLDPQKPESNSLLKRLEELINHIPTNTKIKHTHHLHKGIWISAILSVISILFAWQWLNQIHLKLQYKDNQIKYRYLKAYGSIAVQQLCKEVDSLYKLDHTFFTNSVINAEQRLLEIADSVRIAQERKKN